MWLLGCVDRLDLLHLSAGEHLARRILQIQRAVRKNPTNPEFDSLDVYMRHAAAVTGTVFAPTFDKHVSEIHKNEAQVLKQHRWSKEEEDADTNRRGKRRQPPKNGVAAADPG